MAPEDPHRCRRRVHALPCQASRRGCSDTRRHRQRARRVELQGATASASASCSLTRWSASYPSSSRDSTARYRRRSEENGGGVMAPRGHTATEGTLPPIRPVPLDAWQGCPPAQMVSPRARGRQVMAAVTHALRRGYRGCGESRRIRRRLASDAEPRPAARMGRGRSRQPARRRTLRCQEQ